MPDYTVTVWTDDGHRHVHVAPRIDTDVIGNYVRVRVYRWEPKKQVLVVKQDTYYNNARRVAHNWE